MKDYEKAYLDIIYLSGKDIVTDSQDPTVETGEIGDDIVEHDL